MRPRALAFVKPSLRDLRLRALVLTWGFIVLRLLQGGSVRGYGRYVPSRLSGMGLPRSSKARHRSGVGVVGFSTRFPAKLTVFLVSVARWAISSWYPRTGSLSGVILAVSFAAAAADAGRDYRVFAGGLVIVGKGERRQCLAQVPGEVGGEHADQHVAADPVFQVVVDGTQGGVFGFHQPEVAFQVPGVFVGLDGLGGGELFRRGAGVDHVDPVQGRLCVEFPDRAGILADRLRCL